MVQVDDVNKQRFEGAPTFPEYLDTVEKNREMWHDVYQRVRLPEEVVARRRRRCRGVGTLSHCPRTGVVMRSTHYR